MAHALGGTLTGFVFARSALGFGEAGVFPASIKTVAEWFPRKERALATGIFNAGSNFGAILTPLVVPWITIYFGWRWAFIITGALGFVWLIAWLMLYQKPEEHALCTPLELDYIRTTNRPLRQSGGGHCWATGRPGHSCWVSFSRTRSGGFTYFGFQAFCKRNMVWTCRT